MRRASPCHSNALLMTLLQMPAWLTRAQSLSIGRAKQGGSPGDQDGQAGTGRRPRLLGYVFLILEDTWWQLLLPQLTHQLKPPAIGGEGWFFLWGTSPQLLSLSRLFPSPLLGFNTPYEHTSLTALSTTHAPDDQAHLRCSGLPTLCTLSVYLEVFTEGKSQAWGVTVATDLQFRSHWRNKVAFECKYPDKRSERAVKMHLLAADMGAGPGRPKSQFFRGEQVVFGMSPELLLPWQKRGPELWWPAQRTQVLRKTPEQCLIMILSELVHFCWWWSTSYFPLNLRIWAWRKQEHVTFECFPADLIGITTWWCVPWSDYQPGCMYDSEVRKQIFLFHTKHCSSYRI